MGQRKRTTTAKVRVAPERAIPPVSAIAQDSVDINQLREQISRTVASRAITMVQAVIADVENGHYLPMKFLFEMIGLHPQVASGSKEEESLAGLLLRTLGIAEETTARGIGSQTKVIKDSISHREEATGHAVE